MIQVAVFEEEDEEAVQEAANEFLEDIPTGDVLSVEYGQSMAVYDEEMIRSFSICVVYRVNRVEKGHTIGRR